MNPTHLLVGNESAQSGKNAERIAEARDYLAKAGVKCDFLATEAEGRTIAKVARALDQGSYRCVIAMGGDGTFREVGAGLLATERREAIALGMLPTGTANDQGRSFGLNAYDNERNIEVILKGHETRLDAGICETGNERHVFFDSAGWGLSARILALRNKDRSLVEQVPILRTLYRDQLVYAGAVLKTFLESYVVSGKFQVTASADGEVHELSGLTDLIVKNTRIYAGAWCFDRTSLHDDGLFEVIPFQGKRDWTSKAIIDLEGNPLTEELLNQVGIEHSRSFRARKLILRFSEEQATQLDGEELAPALEARIEAIPKALRLIVP